jgi:biopolymer transport protein ExbD
MSSKKKAQTEVEVAPNLIPMVDIMFLLLLFFMLGADMGHRDIEEVSLPKATSIKDDKEAKGKERDRLTINIFHRYASEVSCPAYASGRLCRNAQHWKIGIRGRDYSDLAQLGKVLKEEADGFRDADNPSEKASDRRVMVRADAFAPYGHIQDVMAACAGVGIYQIECGAARPTDGSRS